MASKMIINNNNKRINEGEASWQASKRKRNEVLNATTGVPFTTPITEFPSGHLLNRLPPPQTHPVCLHPYSSFTAPPEDDHFNSIITQQNFMIAAEINKMRLNMEEFWRKRFAEELKKRQQIEEAIKQRDEAESRFLQMLQYHHERAATLEAQLQQRAVPGEGSSGSGTAHVEEEVNSSFRDPRQNAPDADVACRSCNLRPATMLWYPCRHLCVCSWCDNEVSICPICFRHKSSSVRLNLPWL